MKTRKSTLVGARKSLRHAAMAAAFGLSLLPATVMAARNITLPHSETFDALSSISDIAIFGPAGATVTWLPNTSWDGGSGGAVRITPVTNTEGYGGIGGFNGFRQSRLNVRFLIKFGSNFAGVATMDKLVITNRDGSRNRPMILDAMINTNQTGGRPALVYGPCLGIVCSTPNLSDPRDHPFYVTSTVNVDQWFAFEFEIDLPNKRLNQYIHSRDGRFSGLYASFDMNDPTYGEPNFNSASAPVINVEGIGFYWHPPEERAPLSARNANTYIMIDDVVIDSRYIGPPRNFLGNSPPSAPTAR